MAEIAGILHLPDVRERIAGEAADPVENTPEGFQAFFMTGRAKRSRVVKASKITGNGMVTPSDSFLSLLR